MKATCGLKMDLCAEQQPSLPEIEQYLHGERIEASFEFEIVQDGVFKRMHCINIILDLHGI